MSAVFHFCSQCSGYKQQGVLIYKHMMLKGGVGCILSIQILWDEGVRGLHLLLLSLFLKIWLRDSRHFRLRSHTTLFYGDMVTNCIPHRRGSLTGNSSQGVLEDMHSSETIQQCLFVKWYKNFPIVFKGKPAQTSLILTLICTKESKYSESPQINEWRQLYEKAKTCNLCGQKSKSTCQLICLVRRNNFVINMSPDVLAHQQDSRRWWPSWDPVYIYLYTYILNIDI